MEATEEWRLKKDSLGRVPDFRFWDFGFVNVKSLMCTLCMGFGGRYFCHWSQEGVFDLKDGAVV